MLTMTTTQEAQRLLKMGDYFAVYDCVQKSLEEDSFSSELVYLGLLALAKSGATNQALDLYEIYKERIPQNGEFLSLLARLHKDLCIQSKDNASIKKYGELGRELYLQAFDTDPSYYPLINAAFLSLWIGDNKEVKNLANRVLELCAQEANADGLNAYYVRATEAEAHLLLGQTDLVEQKLKNARQHCPWDLANLSGTYRQLKLICQTKNLPITLLEKIRPPAVITYTGQLMHGMGKSPGIDPSDENAIAQAIADLIEKHKVRVAYGSLACGADILVAEAILKAGGELNIILPFERQEFEQISVAPAGQQWVKRYYEILERADSISQVVGEGVSGHDLLFEACAHQAMGMAHLRSQTLGSKAFQIAVWNEQNLHSAAGTTGAMQRWESLGLENLVVPVPPTKNKGVNPVKPSPPPPGPRRQMKAMIFADVKGFSNLPESSLAVFLPWWMRALQRIHSNYGEHVQYINTWGDASYSVIDDVSRAASIALDMAKMFDDPEFISLKLPNTLGFRVAAHVGPIFQTENPVTGKQDFFGMHVNQTARLEPCTPPGSVYVTEPFAAFISFEGKGIYRCEYVGNHPLPKDFGRIRMYHLQQS